MVSKRRAAIVGPTPETLYWALEHRCPWRTPDGKVPAIKAFQELRALRELSRARRECRITEGIALHSSALEGRGAPILGFLVGDIEQAYGGRAAIDQACGACPANTDRGIGGWAGCHGWLPLLRANTQAENAGGATQLTERIPELVDEVVSQLDLGEDYERLFLATQPRWYGLWCASPWSTNQAELGLRIMAEILRHLELKDEPSRQQFEAWEGWTGLAGLRRLVGAAGLAVSSGIPLHFELVPPGFSDGTTWHLPARCGRCRVVRDEAVCRCCGIRGNLQAPTRRKVLGLRPYLDLAGVIGRDRAKAAVENLRAAADWGSDREGTTAPTPLGPHEA